MAARTVVCPECSETLPYGRLSCPACGSLLAAVAGGRARVVAPVAPAPAPAPDVAAPEPAEPAVATDEAPAARRRRRWRAKQNESSAAEEPQAAVAAGAAPGSPRPPSASPAAGPRRGAPMLAPSKVGAVTLAARLDPTSPAPVPTPPVLGDWVPSGTGALGGPSPWRRDGVQRPRDEDFDGLTGQPSGPAPAGVSNGNGAHGTGGLPAWAGGPPGSSGPVGLPAAVAPVGADRAKAATPPPGAYLPPSGAFSARDSGLPRGQLLLPGSARPSIATSPRPTAAVSSPAAPADEPDAEPRPSIGSLFADLQFDAPKSLPGWLIAAGAAAAIAGFLLPWSRMIPGQGGFGYLDTWGLASSSRLLLLLFTVVTLALAILPNRMPAWLRTGVAGLVLGGLLLGIVWPYLMDGASAIGTLAEATAALLLIIGGLLAVRQERHAEDEPAV